MLSVGSRCPRLESVRRGKPLQPTPAGDGLRPAGAREREHPFAKRQRGNASFAAILEVSRPTGKVKPILDRAIVLPLEGKGNRLRFNEVNCRLAPLRGAFPTMRRTRSIGKQVFERRALRSLVSY